LQRGLKVYVEACSACHSMNLVAFRTLEDLGYSEDQLKALAANYEVEDGPNGDGEMFTRPAVLSDHFPSPFPNEEAAAAMPTTARPRRTSRFWPRRAMSSAAFRSSSSTSFTATTRAARTTSIRC
jgi:cytochrome c1